MGVNFVVIFQRKGTDVEATKAVFMEAGAEAVEKGDYMVIGRVERGGDLEILKDWDLNFELIEDGNDYLIAMTIGDKDEENGIVVTVNAEDFDEFKETLMLVRSQINKRIIQKRKLNRALDAEFKE